MHFPRSSENSALKQFVEASTFAVANLTFQFDQICCESDPCRNLRSVLSHGNIAFGAFERFPRSVIAIYGDLVDQRAACFIAAVAGHSAACIGAADCPCPARTLGTKHDGGERSSSHGAAR